MKCELCGALLRYSSPKAFSAVMRRHRKKAHGQHKGPMKYTNVTKTETLH